MCSAATPFTECPAMTERLAMRTSPSQRMVVFFHRSYQLGML